MELANQANTLSKIAIGRWGSFVHLKEVKKEELLPNANRVCWEVGGRLAVGRVELVTFDDVYGGSLSSQDSGGRAIVRHKVDLCVSLLAGRRERRERDGRHNHLGVEVRELFAGL